MAEANVYGYGPTPTDAEAYGYGQPSNADDTNQYGYEDLGYGSSHCPGAPSDDQRRPRDRPVRRGSVTKYSLEAQKQVKDSFNESATRMSTASDISAMDTETDSSSPQPGSEPHDEKKRWGFGRKK